ncbi:TIF3F1 [Scenedesmus sp. PABB004]|nr:TIF3F1 [Scenedesmus sp. PABB004]
MVASLLLPLSGANITVKVHPVVLLQICDAFIRRPDKQDRVIGTLLGAVADGVVHVSRCYVVPHNESADQVAVDIVHHRTMHELHQRVAPNQIIVGWFSTGGAVGSSDALIQEHYSKEVSTAHGPVHLRLDTSLAQDSLACSAYVSRSLGLGDKPLAVEFVEVPTDVLAGEVERVGANLLVSGDPEKGRPVAEQETLATSVTRLVALLGQAQAYVEDVLAGRRAGDAAVGRYLADTLAGLPHFEAAEFERIFNEGVQDDLLLTYFAHLVRSQVSLAERLGTSALPLI